MSIMTHRSITPIDKPVGIVLDMFQELNGFIHQSNTELLKPFNGFVFRLYFLNGSDEILTRRDSGGNSLIGIQQILPDLDSSIPCDISFFNVSITDVAILSNEIKQNIASQCFINSFTVIFYIEFILPFIEYLFVVMDLIHVSYHNFICMFHGIDAHVIKSLNGFIIFINLVYICSNIDK